MVLLNLNFEMIVRKQLYYFYVKFLSGNWLMLVGKSSKRELAKVRKPSLLKATSLQC